MGMGHLSNVSLLLKKINFMENQLGLGLYSMTPQLLRFVFRNGSQLWCWHVFKLELDHPLNNMSWFSWVYCTPAKQPFGERVIKCWIDGHVMIYITRTLGERFSMHGDTYTWTNLSICMNNFRMLLANSSNSKSLSQNLCKLEFLEHSEHSRLTI